tara:strand:- start:4571 stop:5281 length:711 start_codon:yes stop_codon:yes gene_type:complete
MKILIGIIVVVAAIFAFMQIGGSNEKAVDDTAAPETAEAVMTDDLAKVDDDNEVSEVETGVYEIDTTSSVVNWAGQKPLIEGYVNTGSIALKSGSVEITEESLSGELVIDMTTLSVSETPTKPGSENALESHLKGERWFDVETYGEATFVITDATLQSAGTYEVTGDLTMKGETNPVTFPVQVVEGENGQVVAEADFEIDRTKWGITAGSGSFFDNLADNVVDDMVAMSFSLVANR